MNLDALFENISKLRVGVVGDFCLDIYWQADMRLSSLSLETPHHPLPIVQECISLGAAGNVAACLAALKPQSLAVYGVRGNDWRGSIMQDLLHTIGANTDYFVEIADFCTSAYIKPLRKGISDVVYEDPRLDFEHRGELPPLAEKRLLEALSLAGEELDVLLVCDQLTQGCVTPKVRELVLQLGKDGLLIVTDSRERVGLYKDVIVKPNILEAQAATGEPDGKSAALQLSRITGQPAFVTMGAEGCYLADKDEPVWVPGRKVAPPNDPVGAGDAFHAALALALAAGQPLQEAAAFANTAASVTVSKIGITGTASPDEIRAIY
ncbi:MAG: sugar kinase [Clostridiales bacterium]|nr:sugar kinase [Clostridiales bacterium]